ELEAAAQPDVARELEVVGLVLDVDAGHDVDFALGDADVDRDARAELERDLDQLDAVGTDGDAHEAAAADAHHGQQERTLAGAEVEAHPRRLAGERQLQLGSNT